MTVRKMIQQLVMYPMDSQVVDTNGSPIMFMRFHSWEDESIRLEPKSQIDVNEWLNDFFQDTEESLTSDRDALDELMEQGYTLEDLRNYRKDTYEWAKRIVDEDKETM